MVNYLEETFGLKDGQFIDPNVVIAFGGDVDDALAKVAPEQLMDALLKQVCGHVYDSDDPHMAETPRRFVKMLGELTDSSETFTFTMFESDSREMVIERNISFVSVCAHHLAPFVGTCQLGYIPDGKIAGLSKFPRHIQAMARTLTNQEDLTRNIVESLMDILEPRGVALVMEATHSCMSHRGARAHGTTTITSAMRGIFEDHTKSAKVEFLSLIGSQ